MTIMRLTYLRFDMVINLIMNEENIECDMNIPKTVVMREIIQSWALHTGH